MNAQQMNLQAYCRRDLIQLMTQHVHRLHYRVPPPKEDDDCCIDAVETV